MYVERCMRDQLLQGEVANILTQYKQLLLEHQDAYQAGTVFPDSFYPIICERGQFHDVSESTHWTPFLNASVHYIRENYPLPWDKDTEKLVAFLFGITSHMVADISWHSLGIEQGFLETMGAIDFHNSYSEAHPTGGDVLSQFEFNFNYLARHWYVPVEDLLEIYKKLYGREVITKKAIVDCSYLQFLEMYGEMLAVSKLYPTYSRKSPFLVEQFQEYFLGGLDDMMFWSSNIYHLTSFMLENGTRDGAVDTVEFVICEKWLRAMASADLNQDGYSDLVVGAPGYSHPGHIQVGRVYLIYSNDLGLPPVDLDLDKEAHGILEGFQGAVYIYFGSKQGRVSSSPNITISCQDTYCNLGWTLLAADVNGDREPDLVIGSPFAPGGGKQKGIVAAFYSGPSHSDKENLNVEAANWMVRGEEDYAWLGYSLHGVTINNRTLLLAGSPTWKNASRITGTKKIQGGGHGWRRDGLSFLGPEYLASIKPCAPAAKPSVLHFSLGHLFHTRDEKQSLGQVYGYFPPNCESWFTIAGDKAMGKLGTSLSSGHVTVNGTRTQVLLVGTPTQDDVSKVAFLTMTLHQGGGARMYGLSPDLQPSLLSTFSGDRRFSRFGGVLHLSDLDNDGLDEIIVAAPLRITDVTSGLMGGEDGRVYVYNGKQITSGNMTGKCKSWVAPCPEEKAQYVLISPEVSIF
ncbi:hypothetical protein CB1_000595062 [Camelus ferus]|nr:hypothetical protein CB1_000595062 [Camelus ferus]